MYTNRNPWLRASLLSRTFCWIYLWWFLKRGSTVAAKRQVIFLGSVSAQSASGARHTRWTGLWHRPCVGHQADWTHMCCVTAQRLQIACCGGIVRSLWLMQRATTTTTTLHYIEYWHELRISQYTLPASGVYLPAPGRVKTMIKIYTLQSCKAWTASRFQQVLW